MDNFLFIPRSSADEKICELNAKIESLSGMSISEMYERFKQGYTLQKQDNQDDCDNFYMKRFMKVE